MTTPPSNITTKHTPTPITTLNSLTYLPTLAKITQPSTPVKHDPFLKISITLDVRVK